MISSPISDPSSSTYFHDLNLIGAFMTHFRSPSMNLISLSKLVTTHQDSLSYPLNPPRRPWEPKKNKFQILGLRDPGAVGSDNAPRPPNQDLTKSTNTPSWLCADSHLNATSLEHNLMFEESLIHLSDPPSNFRRAHLWNQRLKPTCEPLQTSQNRTFMFENPHATISDLTTLHILVWAELETLMRPPSHLTISLLYVSSKLWNPFATQFRPLSGPYQGTYATSLRTLFRHPFPPFSELHSHPCRGPRNQISQPQLVLDPL